jgi:hypothetical protein
MKPESTVEKMRTGSDAHRISSRIPGCCRRLSPLFNTLFSRDILLLLPRGDSLQKARSARCVLKLPIRVNTSSTRSAPPL